MATLISKLTLSSSNATSDTLNVTVTDTLNVGEPSVSLSRISLVGDASATGILSASNSTTTYVYIKNTDATNHVKLYTGADELFGGYPRYINIANFWNKIKTRNVYRYLE